MWSERMFATGAEVSQRGVNPASTTAHLGPFVAWTQARVCETAEARRTDHDDDTVSTAARVRARGEAIHEAMTRF